MILASLKTIRCIQNSVKVYSGLFRTLRNARILRTMQILAYLGPKTYTKSSLYRHIQVYSGIFDNDSYNIIKFIYFFTVILTLFNEL